MIEETYPSGRVVKNELDADGALTRVASSPNAMSERTYANSFNYDTSGAVTALRLGNGRWETAAYNNRMQVTAIGLGNSASDSELLDLQYDYGTSTENNGSMREQTITVPTVGSTSGFTAVQDYGYDDLNRLQSDEETVSGNTTWKQTFEIDRYGNRRFDTSTSGVTTTLETLIARKDPSTDYILTHSDILIDGPFIYQESRKAGEYKGSRNQRYVSFQN